MDERIYLAKEGDMTNTIQFREYIHILIRRTRMLAGTTAAAVIISIFVNYVVLDPVYTASTTIIVKGTGEKAFGQYGDIMLSQELVKTCAEISKSNAVMGRVFSDLGLGGDYEEFKKSVNIRIVKETGIIKITASSKNASKAPDISNSLAKALSDEASRVIGKDTLSIIDIAQKPMHPSSPRRLLNTGISAFLAIVTGVFAVFLLEYTDTTVKSSADIERDFKLKVIGVVPNFEKSESVAKIKNSRHKRR